jgi:DNA-binding NarL/FixJ family response regulator
LRRGSDLRARASVSIYVIDDHPVMRDAIAMVMRRLHPQSSVVELARVADLVLRVDAACPPGLILLDLNLPDAVGFSGVRMVRRHFPDVPLAVCSASPAVDAAQECLQAGADVYIEKTADARQLVDRLRALTVYASSADQAVAGEPGSRPAASGAAGG